MKRWLLILLILLWWSTKISSFYVKIVTAFITTNIITCINWKCIWWLSTVWNGKSYQHSYWTINPGNQRFHEQLTPEIRGIIIVNHRCLSFFVMVVYISTFTQNSYKYINHFVIPVYSCGWIMCCSQYAWFDKTSIEHFPWVFINYFFALKVHSII
jgi:hypothetical protein